MESHFKIPLFTVDKTKFSCCSKRNTLTCGTFHARMCSRKTKGKSDINVVQNACMLLSGLCDLWLVSGTQWAGMLLLSLVHVSG